MFRQLAEIYNSRSVIWGLSRTELTLRYRRSVLGFLWSLLNPLLMLLVLSIVFSVVLKIRMFRIYERPVEYRWYLFSVLLPWIFFQGALLSGATSIVDAQSLLKKLRASKIIFPFSKVLFFLLNYLLSLLALFILALILGMPIRPPLLVLPLSILLFVLFTAGIVLFLATVTVYFRDIRHITEVGLGALYFATPIIYPLALPQLAPYKTYFLFNPLTHFMRMFSWPIAYGMWPEPVHIFRAAWMAVAVFAIGLFVFVKFEKKLIYRL
ncbi:MAG: ABC transporter permease [Planctomycetota bacterium]|jgi:ABC-2 type transport system permease protein/lipopolysaccharide transport system permease protein